MKNYRNAIILLLGLILIFLFTSPKISVRIFGFKRQFLLNNFISQTERQHSLDAGEFWKFREFYFPGYITFDKKGFSQEDVATYLNQIGIPLKTDTYLYPFLIFHSDKFLSVEFLVKTDLMDDLVKLDTIKPSDIIYRDRETIIFNRGDQIKLAFLKTAEQMVNANGFLSPLNKEDRPIYQGKHWFVISSVNRH